MNVRCESCETVYRIDPVKVPEGGVRARCTVCSTVIRVSRTSESEAPAVAPSRPQHQPATRDRIANSLGDAYIAPPEEEEMVTTAPPVTEPSPTVPAFTDPSLNALVTPSSTKTPLEPRDPSALEGATASPEPTARGLDDTPTTPIPAVRAPEIPDHPPSSIESAPRESALSQTVSDERAPQSPAEPAEPAAAPPDGPPKLRVSRPFSLPQDLPRPPDIQKPRPTAPVFRPTPGRPVQEAQPARTAPLPERPVNPFMSRDPNQKARRLARALVSDMIVYQPEKRQKALEDGNLREMFEDEIKKSWEEYIDQVGEELASSTPHFNDALNEILAGGQKLF